MKQKGKTLVLLAGLAVATIHIINKMQYTHSTVKNVLACSENNYYEWRFGKIRYTKKGNGSQSCLFPFLLPTPSTGTIPSSTGQSAK